MREFSLMDVMTEIYQLPEFRTGIDLKVRFSAPLLSEKDGILYVVYLGSSAGDFFPTRVFLYNTETGEAEQLTLNEALSFFDIRQFPVEEEPDVPCGKEDEIEDLFMDSIDDDGHLVRDTYRRYISTVINFRAPLEAEYLWAFGG
jgi:hypothetical protein